MALCAICGKVGKSLFAHLRAHKISKVEYERKYPSHPLIDTETAAKCVPTEETRKKASKAVSASNKKRWIEDPDKCWIQLSAARDIPGRCDHDKLSEKAKTQWKDPIFRNHVTLSVSKSTRRAWSKNRDSMLAIALNNAFGHKRIEHRGTRFRSSWEVSFAKILDAQGIKWVYEPCNFKYIFEGSHRRYTPDFWIPDWNSYVEIHPEKFMDAQMGAKIAAIQ
jgi:hypothetical protein